MGGTLDNETHELPVVYQERLNVWASIVNRHDSMKSWDWYVAGQIAGVIPPWRELSWVGALASESEWQENNDFHAACVAGRKAASDYARAMTKGHVNYSAKLPGEYRAKVPEYPTDFMVHPSKESTIDGSQEQWESPMIRTDDAGLAEVEMHEFMIKELEQREFEMVMLQARGYTDGDIATGYSISKATVQRQRTAALAKLREAWIKASL
jgi:hypothetical protein